MGLHVATFTLVADLDGYDPRRATFQQAARAWMVLDRVAELLGEVTVGREMARNYLLRTLPVHEVGASLNALEEAAKEVVTDAFLERVAALARTVH